MHDRCERIFPLRKAGVDALSSYSAKITTSSYPIRLPYGALHGVVPSAQALPQSICLILHGFLVCLAACSLFTLPAWITMAIGGILVSTLYPVLCVNEAKRGPFWFNPLSFYFGWTTLGLGFSPVYISSLIADHTPLPFSTTAIAPQDVAAGYVIALVGSFSLHLGLQAVRPKRSVQRVFRSAPKLSLPLMLLLWAAGLIFIYRPSLFAGVGIMATPLLWGPFTTNLAIALISAKYVRISEPERMIALAFGTLGLLIATAAAQYNSKALVMFAFLPVLFALWNKPRLRGWTIIGAVFLILVYFGIVAPTINASRMLPDTLGEKPLDRVVRSFKMSPLYSGDFSVATYTDQGTQFLNRMFESGSVGFIVSQVRVEGYKYGATMDNLQYAFIPRLLWPGKPIVNRGAWFTSYLGFSATASEATTSTGMDASGELFWNFGIPGVIAGMCLLGLLFGGLWKMSQDNFLIHIIPTLLYVTATFAMFNMPEASTLYVSLVGYYLIFGVLLFLQRTSGAFSHFLRRY